MEIVTEHYARVLLSISPSGNERCSADLPEGTFRLKTAPGVELPPEAFVGKVVGLKGVVLEAGPDKDDWDAWALRHESGLLEVQEWFNCDQYPKSQLLADAERIQNPKPFCDKFVSTDSLGIFCLQCSGSLGMNIKPDQIEHFRGNLCKTCEALPPSTRTGMNFTQEQLVAAYQQMAYERRKDGEKAQKMYEWVCEQAGIDPKNGGPIEANNYNNGTSPWPIPYRIRFVHQTYGPYLNSFTEPLSAQPWARHVRGTEGGPIWEVDTPEGTYEVFFEYFDNHSAGW